MKKYLLLFFFLIAAYSMSAASLHTNIYTHKINSNTSFTYDKLGDVIVLDAYTVLYSDNLYYHVYTENPDKYVVDNQWYHFNYTKPDLYTVGALWEAKTGLRGRTNWTITNECWNAYPDRLKLGMYSEIGHGQIFCYWNDSYYYKYYDDTGICGYALSAGTGATTFDGDWNTYSGRTVSNFDEIDDSGNKCCVLYEEAIIWRKHPVYLLNMTSSTGNMLNLSYNLTNFSNTYDLNTANIQSYIDSNDNFYYNISGHFNDNLNVIFTISFTYMININFSSNTDVRLYRVNDSVLNYSSINNVSIRATEVSSPILKIEFNNNSQAYSIYTTNVSSELNILLQVYDDPTATLTEFSFVAADENYNKVEYATVYASNDGVNREYSSLTSSEGFARLFVDASKGYYVCAEHQDYNQIGTSCVFVPANEIATTISKYLFLGSIETDYNFTLPGTVFVNDLTQSRLNLTMHDDMFNTPDKRLQGTFIALILCIFFGIVLEGKVAGSGITAFTAGCLVFVYFFPLLLIPIVITALIKIFEFTRGFF